MKGINYLTDDKNHKIAVQIDLNEHGELWEDIYDNIVANLRKEDEKIPLDDVIQDLKDSDRLDEKI